MALSDIINVQFSLTAPGVTVAGFGVPLIASPNATWPERTRTYANLTAVAVDWPTYTPEYQAASAMFAQSTGLASVMIGRCANKPTQKFTVAPAQVVAGAIYKLRTAATNNVNVFTDQEVDYTAVAAPAWVAGTAYAQGALVVNDTAPTKFYVATTGGTAAGSGGPTGTGGTIVDNTVTWMYAGSGAVGAASNDAIVYGLKLLCDALIAPALPTANTLTGSAGAQVLQILANVAGAYVGLEALDLNYLATAQTHADPGITADLVALAQASTAWYGLITLYNSAALVQAAATWAEANQKLYIMATMDSLAATQASGTGTDILQTLAAGAFARTGPMFHTANDEFADAAEIARWFPINPGADNWRLKPLATVLAKTYTSTWTTNLEAKFANYYTLLAGTPVVLGYGRVSANQYIDVIRFRDWYVAQLQQRGANLLIQNEKISFTQGGIDLFEAMIRGLNDDGVAAGGIAPNTTATPITVSAPQLAQISTADKQARLLQNVVSKWYLAGAIDKLAVTVQASP